MIVATGLSLPNVPPIVGIEFAKGYENVSLNVDEFENQTVLILGSKTETNSFKKNIINFFKTESFFSMFRFLISETTFSSRYFLEFDFSNATVINTNNELPRSKDTAL